MRYVLALLTFNGLSLIAWGCTGVCRLVYEHTRQLGSRALGLAPASLLAGLLGALLLAVSAQPLMGLLHAAVAPWGLEPSTLIDVRSAGTFAWTFVCGAIAGHVAARLFHVRHAVAGIIPFAIAYGVAAAALAAGGRELAALVAGGSGAPVPLAALAVLASAVGLLSARRHVHRALEARANGSVDGERLTPSDVAVVVCAHNEEEAIDVCLGAVSKLVPGEQIFVANDGSTDGTARVAVEHGCNVLDIHPNGGKARALQRALDHFDICRRFEAVLILDADAQIHGDYLEHALPLFDDPRVAAVAGHAIPKWYPHRKPSPAMFYPAYRTRLYWITQSLLRYGQTWEYSNVSFIVPGFASMYRARVLPSIDVDAQGLSVEDFNMTFDIHRKRLGLVAYSPRARCVSQEAHSLVDYCKQVRRWYLGFWQTVRRHGFWPSLFWISLGIFVVELILQSAAFIALPLVVVWMIVQGGEPLLMWIPQLGEVYLSVTDLLIGVLAADYALTLLVAIGARKPMLALYGLGFVLLRWIDALVFLYALPLAFVEKSDGRWVSPARI